MEAQGKIQGTYQSSDQSFDTKDNRYWIDYFDNGIAKISNSGLVGFINSTGIIICPPKYDRIFPFYQNVAIVCLNNHYGLINRNGEELISPSLHFIDDFADKSAWFQRENNGLWGFLNTSGKIIADGKYQKVSRFQNGSAITFDTEGYLTLISEQDKIIYGQAQAEIKKSWKRIFTDEQWVSLKKNYNLRERSRTPFQFSDGLVMVPKQINGVLKFGFIDSQGNQIIKPIYEDTHNFINGLAAVKKDDLWEVINKKGKCIIPAIYHSIRAISGNLFIVSQNERYGVVNDKNKVVLPLEYAAVKYLFGNSFAVSKNRNAHTVISEIGHWGVFDLLKGEEVVALNFDNIITVNNYFGLAIDYDIEENEMAKKDSLDEPFLIKDDSISSLPPIRYYKIVPQIKVFNNDGIQNEAEYVLNPTLLTNTFLKYSDVLDSATISPLNDSYLIHGKDRLLFLDNLGKEIKDAEKIDFLIQRMHCKDLIRKRNSESQKQGVVNRRNEVVIPLQYERVEIGHSGIILREGDKYGFVDFTGKIILDLIYDQMEETITGVLNVSANDEVYLIDKKGNKI